MAQTLVISDQSKVVIDLDTYNYTVPVAGMYLVRASMSELPPSGLIVALKKNTVAQITSPAPQIAQQLVDVQIVMNCAVNDVIGVTLSSASTPDTGKNVLKGIINIQRGSF